MGTRSDVVMEKMRSANEGMGEVRRGQEAPMPSQGFIDSSGISPGGSVSIRVADLPRPLLQFAGAALGSPKVTAELEQDDEGNYSWLVGFDLNYERTQEIPAEVLKRAPALSSVTSMGRTTLFKFFAGGGR